MAADAGGLSGLLLAGGASRRMAGDKRFMVVGEQNMLDHAIGVLSAVASDITVAVRHGEEALPTAAASVRWVSDRTPFPGPLVALASALEQCAEDRVAVLSCDMPRVPAALLTQLADKLLVTNADVAVVSQEGADEPFPCVLRQRALTPMTAAIARGETSLRRFLADPAVNVHRLLTSEVARHGHVASILLNCNRPRDLAATERPPAAAKPDPGDTT